MNMTDDELLAKTATARGAAHNVPMRPYRVNADGHRWVDTTSRAYAARAEEFFELAGEVKRRGLKLPKVIANMQRELIVIVLALLLTGCATPQPSGSDLWRIPGIDGR